MYLFTRQKGCESGTYTVEPAVVTILQGEGKAFGILVELANSDYAGMGKVKLADSGEILKVEVSYGHGTFIGKDYSGGSFGRNP